MLEAGFPQGVFQTLPIGGVQASKLIDHPGVRAIAVTGSASIFEFNSLSLSLSLVSPTPIYR